MAWLHYWSMRHYEILISKKYFSLVFGLTMKKNWIDNPNPKSDFDFGFSITIQSTKLDCNPD